MEKDLAALQGWFQAAIVTPWTVDQSQLSGVIRDGHNLDAIKRMGIYSHAYQGRLLECMRAEYPVLQHAMGEDLFTRFASEYLIAHPPHSYTLTQLGKLFPQFLKATRPVEESESLWSDFLIELATLERLFTEVFHAAGTEDTDTESATDTQQILEEPGVRVIQCQFALDDYFIETRRYLSEPEQIKPTDYPEAEQLTLLIFRRDYVVRLRRIIP